MSGVLSVAVARQARDARLSDVVCTLGRHDKPYPEEHERGRWTVALVLRGTFGYRGTSASRPFVVRPGWLLFGRPGAGFECSHDHDGGDHCASLAVTERVVEDVSSGSGVGWDKLYGSAPAIAPVSRVAALLELARRRDQADLDEIGYLVAESIVAHALGAPAAATQPSPSHARRILDAMDQIEQGCRSALSLADLADEADLSPFHFLRVFRRVTGTTPHQYLIGARLRLAARLLLDTRRPVTDIAYEVGFQDLSNFVRTFHRAIGCSPRAYRGAGFSRCDSSYSARAQRTPRRS